MRARKSTGMRIIVMFASLVLIVLSVIISEQIQDDELYAATTTEDIKIIDFAPGQGAIGDHGAYAVSEDGFLYYNANAETTTSYFKKIKMEDGKELSNVKNVYTSYYNPDAAAGAVFAVTNNNKLYAYNAYGNVLGTGDPAYVYYPTLIDTSGIPGNIKKITSDGVNTTFMLMDTGDVYATGGKSGEYSYACGQLGPTCPETSRVFIKTAVSNMKDISRIATNNYGIDNNGILWGWGFSGLGGSGYGNTTTSKKMNYLGSDFNEKVIAMSSGYGSSYHGCGDGVSFVDEHGKLYFSTYYAGSSTAMLERCSLLYGVGANFDQISEAVNLAPYDFSGVTSMDGSGKSLSFVKNGTLYMAIADPISTANIAGLPYRDLESNQSSTIKPYVKGQINESTRIKKAMAVFADTWVLRDDNKLFYRGNPVTFAAEIGIEGKNPDNSPYKSSEKSKNDVTLYFNKGDGHSTNKMVYSVKDLPNGDFGPEIDVPDSEKVLVEANRGERVYKEYKVRYADVVDSNYATFIVDLYNHDFEDVSTVNNGGYAKGYEATWDTTNGLSGNIVEANLKLPDGSSKTIANGHVLNEEGAITLELMDLYQNYYSAKFNVTDVPNPISMLFTPSGELRYKSSYTTAGGSLGTLELEYEAGKEESPISTMNIVSGIESDYFEINQEPITKTWTLKAKKEVPVGDYTLKFSGKNTNNADFRNFSINFTVKKADSPMEWNSTTKEAENNNIYVNEALTVGVINKPAEVGNVTYELSEAVQGVSIDSTTGVVTITEISGDSVDIPIKATTAATPNYEKKELTVTIKALKQTINLKTVMVVNGTNVDHHSIDLGTPLPTFAIASSGSALPDGVTLEQIKPNDYKIIEQGDVTETAITKIIKDGVYVIIPIYTSNVLDAYKVNFSYATISASKVVIDDSNASDYYTLTLNDGITSYAPGTWTNGNIKITPKHSVYNKMKVDDGSFSTGTQTYPNEGTNSIKLTFQTNDNIATDITIDNIQIDKTKPTLNAIDYQDTNASTFANFMRALSFDHFFNKEKQATFSGVDISGSGIANYQYKITEIDDQLAQKVPPVIFAEGEGATVVLAKNKNYKLEVTAIDNAKNQSDVKIEYIQISDEAPEIKVDAVISGTETKYDGSTWTSKAIDVTLSSEQTINKYSWSTDAVNFTDLADATYTIDNTDNINNQTYTFKGISQTDIPGTKSLQIKIDKDIPIFNMSVKDSGGDDYNGSLTDENVSITLSQSDDEKNISGVEYYYCSDPLIEQTDPAKSKVGWTKVEGNRKTFDTDQANKTYYFKAVSNAGLSSATSKSQVVNIEKKIENPVGLVWKIPGDEEVTYGSSIPLIITLDGEEVSHDLIKITATGGTNCLAYNEGSYEVEAISGTCASGGEMKITATVGNYIDPMPQKTITAKKAEIQLQTAFVVNGSTSKTANILKDGIIPERSVDYVIGKGLVGNDKNLVENANALGPYTTEYKDSDGVTIPLFDTSTMGSFKVKHNLTINAVTLIPNFKSKYAVKTLEATLNIGDNTFSDEELYEISGETKNGSGWYVDKVTITPIHSAFLKMGIGSQTPQTGPQDYPSGEIIPGSSDVTLVFQDSSSNEVTKKPTIKIDNMVPEVTVSATSNGQPYSGTMTEHNVTISLSQPNDNVSGVTYYYCTDENTSNSNPTGSGWTKVVDDNGKSLTLNTTQNKTYYFKAESGAGLVSANAESKDVLIQKKVTNPDDMDWTSGIKDDLAYGDEVTLSIDNTNGESVTYSSTGGSDCLKLDSSAGTITAISGVCSTGDMQVTATVGNYATPLKRTFKAHRVNLDFQTVFIKDGVTKTSETIFKGDSAPQARVQFANGTSLASDESGLSVDSIGTYNTTYTLNGNTTTGIDTNVVGEYKVVKKLDSSSITISNFSSKYAIRLQASAILSVSDTSFNNSELFKITGEHVNDEWYTSAVNIEPIHEIFTKMAIDGGNALAGVQRYPKDGNINVDTTVTLRFENAEGSTVTKAGIPVKIDSIKPTFTIIAKSNEVEYTSGSSTLYDIDIQYVATNTNISNATYFYTTDVLSNGNVKPNATWIESGDFTIVENATYYFKAVSGAGLESTPKKFIANINKPDTTKTPTITTTSNNKPFVADGSTWARNDVTFKLAGNATGYEVCVSTNKDRSVDCDDQSYNWTTIDDESNSIHSITQDQDATYYWFRNKLPGFQTTASEAYIVMIDNVLPDTPQITVTEKQNALMALFARSSGAYHNKAVDVAIDAQDDRSGLASITYDIYDAEGTLLKENQSYTEALTYEDTNIQIRAKAIDKAGNISEVSNHVGVRVDTIAPQISGVKDEASYYVPYLFISYQDSGSGIDSTNTTYTNNDKTEELGNNTLFNGKGNVSVNVQDLAGNASSISFEMLGLPEHTDCSTQSMALIDTVKAQYDEVKGHLNDTQKKEVTDWMAKASSSCSVTDPDHNVTVENPDAKIPENTVLVVDVITTTIDDVELSLEKDEEVKVAYDVYFKKGETVFKDLEGSEMKVKLPLGAFKGAKGLRLVSVEEDGKAKDIVYVTEGEYAVFTTSELKRYAFIAEKSTDPNVNVDTDCDGTPDINIDTGDDGIPDINIDTTGDGEANYNVDIDDDQIPDVNIGPIDWNPDKCVTTPCGKAYCTSTYYKPYLNIDTDGDMRPDINIDLDKDMEADINIDTDFDDIPNIDIDSDGDGKADINIDKDGDGKADQNLLDLKQWKPELNVDTPFKYDTMAGLKADTGLSGGDDSSDDANTSNKDQDDKNQNKQVDITPTVKGSYTGGIGGAMTGQTNQLPVLIVMLLSSTCVLLKMKKKKS